ncbi:hypothetical protein Sango_3044100 [Sesamum angolense]|uniref:Reverse transcriptase zinc-binding domain-containing protein n=1 Tax=Sesamum angolense TaxID=2727404 RepID=A0AAE1T9M8_9LAMI|nr:hypothetical protein Sango_3044100 [Sesamum angolense]
MRERVLGKRRILSRSSATKRTSGPSTESIDEILRGMPRSVNVEMNEALIQPFLPEEVKRALFQMLITDNVLIAYELNHYFAHKTLGSVGHVALKLDLSKAYDRVEWSFLVRVLAKSLLTSIPKGHFVKEIPYRRNCSFFVEALSHLISTAEAFEEASGLMVNFAKSSVAFSRNTSDDIRTELANILRVCVVAKHEKYLGLPALMGCSKRDIFQDMKDKVWKRLQSWKCINLSQAGKLVLLKSVVQVMLTFVMGCFLIPTTLCLELRHIGTGQNVCIWKDRGWNEALIRSFFRPEDAGLILGIGRFVGSPDHLCWHFEKRGHYLVRRAYRIIGEVSYHIYGLPLLVRNHINLRVGVLSSMLLFPQRFRLFACRACRDALPTSCKIASRGVLVEGACQRFGEEGDDLIHILLRCHFAHLVWAMSCLPWRSISCHRPNLETWFRDVFQDLNRSGFARALLIYWAV